VGGVWRVLVVGFYCYQQYLTHPRPLPRRGDCPLASPFVEGRGLRGDLGVGDWRRGDWGWVFFLWVHGVGGLVKGLRWFWGCFCEGGALQ